MYVLTLFSFHSSSCVSLFSLRQEVRGCSSAIVWSGHSVSHIHHQGMKHLPIAQPDQKLNSLLVDRHLRWGSSFRNTLKLQRTLKEDIIEDPCIVHTYLY